MTVSVIIPTYNGAHKIGNILHALEAQTRQPDEILVVIDGSTDGTEEAIAAGRFNLPQLRVIVQENKGRAGVRNRGALEANGELLIFFDDDMRPVPETIAQHVAHQEAFPQSIVTGSAVEEYLSGMPDFLKFRAGLSRKWSVVPDGPKMPLPASDTFLTAANFSILKSHFEVIGGFDPVLKDAEDYDLGVRAAKAGIPLYADFSIHAWHNDPVTCTGYIRRLRQYAVAQEKLAALKPELYGAVTKYGTTAPAGLKKVFFSLFCSSALIRSVDAGRWRWLPQALRFRLYDYIVTANGSFFPEKVKLA